MNRYRQNTGPRVSVIPARERTTREEEHLDGEKKKIGVYVRVSTESEAQASSYDIQVSYFREYVESNPRWELVEIFTDEGVTGTSTKNRIGFNKMIEACKDKKVDYILTKSISRFARNTLDCLFYIRMLKDLDIGIYFQKENIDTLDSKGEMMITIISSLAQEESHAISENTKWGIQKRVQQGKVHMPTTYFLGYDTNEAGEVVIDEEQAKVVRRIFKEHLGGSGTAVIARRLMEDGVLTVRGNKKWTSDSVYKILRNEKYMGDCLAQKSVTLDFLSHERVRNNGHQAQYYVRDTHPAIISEEDWNTVQQELKRRRELYSNPDGKYKMCYSGKSIFSNKLFCGECGRPVTRRRFSSTSKGEKYTFTAWHCRVAAQADPHFKDCRASYVREHRLEEAFMRVLKELKDNSEKTLSDGRMAREGVGSLTIEEENRLEELELQLQVITNRISEMASKPASGSTGIYEATMRHLTYEQEILQIEYEGLRDSQEDNLCLKREFEKLLECLEEVGEEFNDDIFFKTVEKVIVSGDYEVEFIFNCGISRKESARHQKKPKKSTLGK